MSTVGYIYMIAKKDGLDDPSMCYIGSTLSFKRRQYFHAKTCKSNKYPDWKLYKYMRENGGWGNFRMSLLEEVPIVKNKFELTARETHWVKNTGAQLNIRNPPRTPPICEHGKKGTTCRECKGVSVCEHNKYKHSCRMCVGSTICPCGRERNKCPVCDPEKYAKYLVANRERARARRAAAKAAEQTPNPN